MDKIASVSPDDRKDLFKLTETKSGIPAVLVEKDFWVCWTLEKLFTTKQLDKKILFKGGTTLSKIFDVIERFSEDIDLILDWSEFVHEPPYEIRSNTQQTRFNKKVNSAANKYLESHFVPLLNSRIKPICEARIDTDRALSIIVKYPAAFKEAYVRPEVLLETGPLAAWEPHGSYTITPYAAKSAPEMFKSSQVSVRAIKAERTFWEKVTILHVEAHRTKTQSVKERHSRHYYDIMKLAKSEIKERALQDLELLKQVVEFKKKFYYQKWARYNLAVPKTIKLVPPAHIQRQLKTDYSDMRIMIFGSTPPLEEIMDSVRELEREINRLG